ncbi:L-dopachrome tautomerase yellow-f isoform X2 [Toxorhynchites rutilus septentrionalis]|nr:L-dopachrome tautomerase yellow-f isoform X2 [Toxorhynchites rutilus septentrionalis]XP_055617291.1 L-dopachrome tautomerase yellow-f isoform X2 [Toxorhynchites rutilus septentrionalis]XP_055617292.1 L-dopachrome tautomerase yellow-f isoform X2 [Toxorhynchites rutilus septentrionalis]
MAKITLSLWRMLITLSILLQGTAYGDKFEEVFHWKQLVHARDLKPDSGDIVFEKQPVVNTNETFVSYNNIPMGVTHHKGRLFIAIPRRRPGVPATLTTIDISSAKQGMKSPPLNAYPDYIVNQLHNDYHADPKRIVSVYRSKVDACERLWFIDTGMLEYPDNPMQVHRPQLWIIDLARDRKVRTFEIPEAIVQQGIGMASLVVDVEAGSCDKAFAYIPDLVQGAIYVYNFEANRMWAFRHSTFQHDPQRASFHVAGLHFDWDDGIFSITLGKKDPLTQSRPVYYHPMVSTSEFMTTTETLQNEGLANSGGYENLFQNLGERGPNTQCTMHHYDPGTETIFYAQVNRNSIGCWNTKSNFTAENHDTVHLDNKRMIYPTDLNADVDGKIWVLSNSLPIWIYSQLDVNQFNFHIWRQTPRKAIAGSKCEI